MFSFSKILDSPFFLSLRNQRYQRFKHVYALYSTPILNRNTNPLNLFIIRTHVTTNFFLLSNSCKNTINRAPHNTTQNGCLSNARKTLPVCFKDTAAAPFVGKNVFYTALPRIMVSTELHC